MEKQLSKRAFVTIVILIALIAFFIAVGIFVNQADATGVDEYPTNEEGMSYGSAANASTSEQEPDLIAVEATNGESGYVYKTALYAADQTAANPEHAVQLMEEREARSLTAFNKALNEELFAAGLELRGTGEEILANFIQGNTDGASNALFAETVSLASNNGTTTGSRTVLTTEQAGELIQRAYQAAEREVCTSIPVYESDGKTVIGEFLVGGLWVESAANYVSDPQDLSESYGSDE